MAMEAEMWVWVVSADLGDDLSKSMSLSSGVGKVSSQSVVLNRCRVMSWGTHKVGGCVTHNSSSWGHSHGASTGISNERGEKQEGLQQITSIILINHGLTQKLTFKVKLCVCVQEVLG